MNLCSLLRSTTYQTLILPDPPRHKRVSYVAYDVEYQTRKRPFYD
uniref:Uncharacterized protein n=1 Tax=Rhizophora mucronata TaxID=61149 RepID=A0A2P2MYK1_RHIMU